jgi:D-lactate dehydrogenase
MPFRHELDDCSPRCVSHVLTFERCCFLFMPSSAMPFEVAAFEEALSSAPGANVLDFIFISSRLDAMTALLAQGAEAVCLFVRDTADAHVMRTLSSVGVRLIALRCAGVASVDLRHAAEIGIRVARTPHHAPTSIAEYTVSMIMALNRKIHIAHNRVRDGNLSLNGLVGFDMLGKTVGIIGTGKVGRSSARILAGFGCNVLAYDIIESEEVITVGGRYVSMAKLFASSDIILLHAPLLPATHHIISDESISRCKKGVMIVNTSRGGLIDVRAAIDGLRSGQIGALGMDVYEGEAGLFFRDNTGEMLDPDFQVLQSMPNVIITGHQSTLTESALEAVANATVRTLLQFRAGDDVQYEIKTSAVPNARSSRLPSGSRASVAPGPGGAETNAGATDTNDSKT